MDFRAAEGFNCKLKSQGKNTMKTIQKRIFEMFKENGTIVDAPIFDEDTINPRYGIIQNPSIINGDTVAEIAALIEKKIAISGLPSSFDVIVCSASCKGLADELRKSPRNKKVLDEAEVSEGELVGQRVFLVEPIWDTPDVFRESFKIGGGVLAGIIPVLCRGVAYEEFKKDANTPPLYYLCRLNWELPSES